MIAAVPTHHTPRFDARRLAEVLALAALYFVTARLGLLLAIPGGHVTPVWPPSGIALAAMLLRGRWVWPGIWLGSFAANFWDFHGSPMSLATELATSAVFGAGAGLAALLGYQLLRLFVDERNPLERVRDVCAFMALGGVVSCLLSATVGVTTLCLAGFAPWSGFGQTWLTWWLGDTAGVFIVAPLLLVWGGARWLKSAARGAELFACFGLLLAVAYYVFIENTTALFGGKPFTFVLIPFLVWPALRFGQRGAAVAAGLIALLAVWGTIHHTGPFNVAPRNESLLLLELFLSVVVLTALCMAAVVTEREHAEAAQQRAVDELERRVQERTAALTQSEAQALEHLAKAQRARVALLSILEDERAAEAALRASEARIRNMFEQASDAIFVVSADNRFLEVNARGLEMTGYTRDEFPGLGVAAVLVPHERPRLDIEPVEVMAGQPHLAEWEYLRKDGSTFPAEVSARRLTDHTYLAIVRDLTERKNLEQQFLRAQRMESIGTLAGGIAHDLNNVLGPIILSLDLLKLRFTDSTSEELLGIIAASARRGADMVGQVLSFARGVEGRRMEVQIKHLVQDIEKFARDTFPKNIQVRTSIPYDLWTVLGDPTQLHQVLLNLCVNARDAMPNGGTLTLSAENLTLDAHYAGMNLEAHPGPYVFLQVEDRGTGMSPAVIEKIFDPFFTTKEIGKGTGLGLSTSLAIVKSHGGFLRVYSEAGKGTKFHVNLPALTETAPTAAAAEVVVEMPRGHGELILVVDDEASVRRITQQTLEAFGYRVILASDGAEAVATYAARSEEIAAVLTDMMMPIMDGPATIQVLRKMNPAVRIIGASGLAVATHVAQSASLGVQHFLPKPYTGEALLKVLRQVLSGEH